MNFNPWLSRKLIWLFQWVQWLLDSRPRILRLRSEPCAWWGHFLSRTKRRDFGALLYSNTETEIQKFKRFLFPVVYSNPAKCRVICRIVTVKSIPLKHSEDFSPVPNEQAPVLPTKFVLIEKKLESTWTLLFDCPFAIMLSFSRTEVLAMPCLISGWAEILPGK